ncbi:hypothetical protein FE633_13265 [Streptomyces montanus]|uniref:ASCH domain-containing protein n=1 Tax=Streptomyces montanus TaxID=2580423 RepID=A0A5R9FQV8_9ACTN|nr:hypothetical protein [Streptomyces montanus]TLS45731.1 hypothetical protein FE633_13265 [Streptomyces montanus]
MTKPVIIEPYAVRALTLWQPYASAVAVLGKDIENRDWPPGSYRGLILVHAGLDTDQAALRHMPRDMELPSGAVVAVARIAGAHTDCDGRCSRWADCDSAWHWEFSHVVRLPAPVTQVKGRQRLWVPGDPLRRRVAAALPRARRQPRSTPPQGTRRIHRRPSGRRHDGPMTREDPVMSVHTHEMTLTGALAESAVLVDGQAYFRVLYAPEDHSQRPAGHEHEVREAVLPCALADPVAAADLAELQPGAPLTVSGYLALPDTNTTGLRLVVLTVDADLPKPRQPVAARPALRLVRTDDRTPHLAAPLD